MAALVNKKLQMPLNAQARLLPLLFFSEPNQAQISAQQPQIPLLLLLLQPKPPLDQLLSISFATHCNTGPRRPCLTFNPGDNFQSRTLDRQLLAWCYSFTTQTRQLPVFCHWRHLRQHSGDQPKDNPRIPFCFSLCDDYCRCSFLPGQDDGDLQPQAGGGRQPVVSKVIPHSPPGR